MKSKKSVISVILLIAGAILALYFAITFDLPIRGLRRPAVVIPTFPFDSHVLEIPFALSLLFAGIIGVFTRNRTAKIIMYAVSLCEGLISMLYYEFELIYIAASVIALIALIIECVDKSKEKKLYFLYDRGYIGLAFSHKKIKFTDVYKKRKKDAEKDAKLQESQKAKKTAKPSKATNRKSAVVTIDNSVIRHKLSKKKSPYAGRAIVNPKNKRKSKKKNK